MGILSALFGRTKLRKPNREVFFAVVTAESSLQGRTDLRQTGQAGIVFNPVESQYFDELKTELQNLLHVSGRSTGTKFHICDDSFGTRWVTLEDQHFEDLTSTIHLVSETIYDHGFGDRLLAAVFKFKYQNDDAYLIYSYKRGAFYPFIPTSDQQRNNASELRLGATMDAEQIPIENNIEQWYALWGIPF